MDTYILRIYKRSESRPDEVVGLSEHVETGKQDRFENIRQLSGIIVGPKTAEAKTGPTQTMKHQNK